MTSFYLKYRPKNIEELDLREVRERLIEVLKGGGIPHALLFSGPKGTGKTSAARIVAKIVNCEKRRKNSITPCDKCSQCTLTTKGANLDVIEMDAASNRGIDDVRALRDAIKLSPVSGKTKVYIIDEAHMLTTEASNALLKTLEEPPDHVLFIMATTNPEKLIPTIRSRVTTISFKKANTEETLRSLERVIIGEKIKIEKEGKELIAKNSGGSFRDAVKVLELLSHAKRKITKVDVDKVLMGGEMSDAGEMVEALSSYDAKKAIKHLAHLVEAGLDIKLYMENLLDIFRKSLLAKVGIGEDKIPSLSKDELLSLLRLLTRATFELKTAFIEELPLELAIVEWCGGKDEGIVKEMMEDEEEMIKKEKSLKKKTEKREEKTSQKEKEEKIAIPEGNLKDEDWKKILDLVRPKNASTEALLRAAKPLGFDGKSLTLGVFYSFHKERLEDGLHRQILQESIEALYKTPVKITCLLTEPPPKKIIEEKEENILTEGGDPDIIKVAKEIFGN